MAAECNGLAVPNILLVIPHYRDTERLAPFLGSLLEILPENFSILVSDDGSGEDEFSKLQKLISAHRDQIVGQKGSRPELLEPVRTHENQGKGAAVRRGWSLIGEGFDTLAFADADGAVSAVEIKRACEYFEQHSGHLDFLLGSRIKMLGKFVHRRFIRHLSGRVFATLVATITNLQVYDSQCGLKIIKGSVFSKIKPYCKSNGFAFDVELLLLVQKSGCEIEEFPVDWRDVSNSKVSLLIDSWPMLTDIYRMKKRIADIEF